MSELAIGARASGVVGAGFHVAPSIYWNKIRQNEQPIDHFDFYFASAGASAVAAAVNRLFLAAWRRSCPTWSNTCSRDHYHRPSVELLL